MRLLEYIAAKTPYLPPATFTRLALVKLHCERQHLVYLYLGLALQTVNPRRRLLSVPCLRQNLMQEQSELP